jgi:hypothetical protein
MLLLVVLLLLLLGRNIKQLHCNKKNQSPSEKT